MSATITNSKPFSSGTEYEVFVSSFCDRCKHGKRNQENGFPEYVENGGCVVWDAMECARLDTSAFPSDDVVRIQNGDETYFHVCKYFESDNQKLMESYNALFTEENTKEDTN